MIDNIEIAINHLMRALQDANDDFEYHKTKVISELEDFSDWCFLIKDLEDLLEVCNINDKIHKQIESLDELLRYIKGV